MTSIIFVGFVVIIVLFHVSILFFIVHHCFTLKMDVETSLYQQQPRQSFVNLQIENSQPYFCYEAKLSCRKHVIHTCHTILVWSVWPSLSFSFFIWVLLYKLPTFIRFSKALRTSEAHSWTASSKKNLHRTPKMTTAIRSLTERSSVEWPRTREVALSNQLLSCSILHRGMGGYSIAYPNVI